MAPAMDISAHWSCSSRRLLDVGAAATSFEASAAAAADLINDDLRLMDHCESRLRRCLHFHTPGVDILRNKPKNAPGDIYSAVAKFPEYPKLSGSTP